MENTKEISVELTTAQYDFLVKWQKEHEQELGIEVPVSAMVRKTVEIAMKAAEKKDERPPRPDRDSRPPRSFDKPGFKPGGPPRKSFGAPRGPGGPKFSMMGKNNKTKTF